MGLYAREVGSKMSKIWSVILRHSVRSSVNGLLCPFNEYPKGLLEICLYCREIESIDLILAFRGSECGWGDTRSGPVSALRESPSLVVGAKKGSPPPTKVT